MEFVITPYSKGCPAFATWENAFDTQELDILQRIARDATETAKVGDNQNNPDIRRTKLSWLKYEPDTAWVFARLAHVVSSLNVESFNFNLTGFGESLQMANYDSKDVGSYGWHQDFSYGNGTASVSRKLSLVLQLSDASEYEGGYLEVNNNKIIRMKKQRGLIIVFPSWVSHQVTPVTYGTRQSLVSWVTGPAFI